MTKTKDELRKLRSEQMKEINKKRSIEVQAILDLIAILDLVDKKRAKLMEENWGVKNAILFNNEINSYRANKIALALNKRINKQKLLMFAKSKDHQYKLTSSEFNELLNSNIEPISILAERSKLSLILEMKKKSKK